jgi:hypothetical protein
LESERNLRWRTHGFDAVGGCISCGVVVMVMVVSTVLLMLVVVGVCVEGG